MKRWVIVLSLMSVVGCRWTRDADDTVYNEFKASSLLDKYTYFKKASAVLEAKAASIKVNEAKLKALEEQYKGVARKDWARTDAEQSSIWSQEVAGAKASYNSLAADYNAKMVMENYRFCNVGELPKGATVPLTRDFKPYIEN